MTILQPARPQRTLAGVELRGRASRARGRARRGRALLVLRRLHLYSGLVLVPWVLLYGATALLFNHSTWWSASSAAHVPAQGESGSGLRPLAAASEHAASLLQQVSPQGSLSLEAGSARWIGALQLAGTGRDAAGDGLDVRFALDPDGRGGVLRWSPRDDAPHGPAWLDGAGGRRHALLGEDARANLLAAATGLARERGLELDALSVRRLPELEFRAADAAGSWNCTLDSDGALAAEASCAAPDWRRRLLRLHVQHGDPGHPGVRRIWALLVDVVGTAMVLWGLSGVVTWWTVRPTRRPGTVLVLAGALAMAALAASLWAESGSSSRNGPWTRAEGPECTCK